MSNSANDPLPFKLTESGERSTEKIGLHASGELEHDGPAVFHLALIKCDLDLAFSLR
jgi:hypothetical protein